MKHERKMGSRARGKDAGADEGGNDGAPPWVVEFLTTLITSGSVRHAVAAARIDFEEAWDLREREPAFAGYWDRAVRAHRRIAAGEGFVEVLAEEKARAGR